MSQGNRHILITGASGGIGAAVATALADKATRLTLVARDKVRLDALADALKGKAAAVDAVPFDLGTTARFESLVGSATAAQGPIDVLVNCAGVNAFKRLTETDPVAIGSIVATNILAPMLLSRAVLPQMIANGSRDRSAAAVWEETVSANAAIGVSGPPRPPPRRSPAGRAGAFRGRE